MFKKKVRCTIITPIPSFVPGRLAVEVLHGHEEVISLNPLVLKYEKVKAPRYAAADEYFSTWYEIKQRVQYVPGLGKLGSGDVVFQACFHDLSWGLQTHIYAPFNVELRNRYCIAGNQPGIRPSERQEIGLAALGAPKEGLYLREDIEIQCNLAIIGHIKAQMKAASKKMVERIIKKAELLDASTLQTMGENHNIAPSPHPYNDVHTTSLTPGVKSLPHSPLSPHRTPIPLPTPHAIARSVSSTSGWPNNPLYWSSQGHSIDAHHHLQPSRIQNPCGPTSIDQELITRPARDSVYPECSELSAKGNSLSPWSPSTSTFELPNSGITWQRSEDQSQTQSCLDRQLASFVSEATDQCLGPIELDGTQELPVELATQSEAEKNEYPVDRY